jgi:hypothetical protein
MRAGALMSNRADEYSITLTAGCGAIRKFQLDELRLQRYPEWLDLPTVIELKGAA